MTLDQFEDLILAGRKLVILDDMICDVEPFLLTHPGGIFVLERNIGRDVSKFFFGGYALDGNKPG